MQIKTFQARTMLELLDAVRASLGPCAVLLWVKRIPASRESEAFLEGAAAVDPEPVATRVAVSAPAPTGAVLRTLGADPSSIPSAVRRGAPQADPSAHRVSEKLSWFSRRSSSAEEAVPRSKPRSVTWAASPKNGPVPPIVLLGPSGAGKTTSAAKLAVLLQNATGGSVGLIAAGRVTDKSSELLSCAAREHGLLMTEARTALELRDRLDRWDRRGAVVMDLQGQWPKDEVLHLELLDALDAYNDPVEIHLVLSAAAPAAENLRTLRSFAPLGYGHVLMTHLDCADPAPNVLAQVKALRLPVSFLGTGARIPQDLKQTTPADMLQFLSRC